MKTIITYFLLISCVFAGDAILCTLDGKGDGRNIECQEPSVEFVGITAYKECDNIVMLFILANNNDQAIICWATGGFNKGRPELLFPGSAILYCDEKEYSIPANASKMHSIEILLRKDRSLRIGVSVPIELFKKHGKFKQCSVAISYTEACVENSEKWVTSEKFDYVEIENLLKGQPKDRAKGSKQANKMPVAHPYHKMDPRGFQNGRPSIEEEWNHRIKRFGGIW